MHQETAILRSTRPLAKALTELVLYAPETAKAAKAGQFVHVLVPDGRHILRRPISLMGFDAQAGTLTLAIQPKGRGTQILCSLPEGTELDLIGPLGTGFEGEGTIYFVGGGVGVAPMAGAMHALANERCRAFFGFRGKEYAYGMENAPCPVIAVSDDGTLGEKALVTVPLKKAIEERRPDVIMACGPTPMLRAVQALAKETGVPCRLSLEERMACGIGACLGCNVKVKDETAPEGWGYQRVCHDGPVFDGEKVLL